MASKYELTITAPGFRTKAFKDLTPGVKQLFTASGEFSYDIAPDGSAIALTMNSTPPPFREENNADIYLVSADGSGVLKNLTPENKGTDSAPAFAMSRASRRTGS